MDTVIGIVYAKDLLRETHRHGAASATPAASLEELLRPPVFVLAHQRIGAVLQQLKHARTHLALVLDEYGQVDGLVTVEDILEELAGDIADEYDEAETQVVRRDDGSFLVEGLMAYADAQTHIGLPPREALGDLPDFETVAGLVLALLGRIPSAGETAVAADWALEVVDMDGMRIDKLLVRRTPSQYDRAQNEGSLAISAVLPPPTDHK